MVRTSQRQRAVIRCAAVEAASLSQSATPYPCTLSKTAKSQSSSKTQTQVVLWVVGRKRSLHLAATNFSGLPMIEDTNLKILLKRCSTTEELCKICRTTWLWSLKRRPYKSWKNFHKASWRVAKAIRLVRAKAVVLGGDCWQIASRTAFSHGTSEFGQDPSARRLTIPSFRRGRSL